MTEGEWLTCTDPTPMLEFLRGKISDRKLRLFDCACCRQVWGLLEDERGRRAVEVSERFADGLCDVDELQSAFEQAAEAAEAAHWENRAGSIQTAAEGSAMASCGELSLDLAIRVASTMAEAAGDEASDAAWETTWTTPGKTNQERWAEEASIYKVGEADEKTRQADRLRDIFGNPFRSVTIDRFRLTPSVLELAQTIYDELAFHRLPELADALEVAGCDGTALLSHSRGPGPHVRGCWVVDLILGRS